MRKRWVRIGALAAGLIAINFVARLVVRFWFINNYDAQDRIALFAFGAVALTMAVAAFVWGRRLTQHVALANLALAAAAGALVSILLGPLVAGASPFREGTAGFFSQLALYAGFAAGGAMVGFFTLIALGQDHKSRSLQRYAESRLTKPRRV